MSNERSIHWPEENIHDGRGWYYPHLNELPEYYVTKNQKFWRNSPRRGKLSKVTELPHTADVLHRRVVDTFGLEGTVKPILAWSVLFDRPKDATSEYMYEQVVPDHIPKEDKNNWTIGIVRMTEYATNYATKEFFRRNMDFVGGRTAVEFYNLFSDILTYKIIIGGTFGRMGVVEHQANRNGKNYKDSVLTALFKHDFAPLNELIADTKEGSGCSNIDDLAIQIGRERHKKPDIGKWLGKLEVSDTNSEMKKKGKNLVVSALAGGVYRNPGVTEISAGTMTLLYSIILGLSAYSIASAANTNPEEFNSLLASTDLGTRLMGMSVNAIASSIAPAIMISPFVAVHESIHHYSSDREFVGLMPAKLVRKEAIPLLQGLDQPKET